jgi:hypothetical protein
MSLLAHNIHEYETSVSGSMDTSDTEGASDTDGVSGVVDRVFCLMTLSSIEHHSEQTRDSAEDDEKHAKKSVYTVSEAEAGSAASLGHRAYII